MKWLRTAEEESSSEEEEEFVSIRRSRNYSSDSPFLCRWSMIRMQQVIPLQLLRSNQQKSILNH